jgi:hypothetical protein
MIQNYNCAVLGQTGLQLDALNMFGNLSYHTQTKVGQVANLSRILSGYFRLQNLSHTGRTGCKRLANTI